MTDTKEIRDAKEAVTEAKENIQIADLEKDISGLNDTIDDLDKKIEESNKYYDTLIGNAENYWDSLIKGLEDYKSRWKELADIEEQAKMGAALKNLDITTDDILNMSESAFESFKGTYLGLLNEMYAGNDEMLGMLQKFGGISTDTLLPLSGTLESVADSLDNFAGSTSGTVAAVHSVSDALNEVPGVDMSGSIEQFNTLGSSVDSTTASISGKAKADRSSGSVGKNVPNTQSSSGNGSDNLISSIANVGETTAETLGESGGDGAIGKFGELGDTIADAEGHVTGIADGLDAIDGMTAECSIRVNVETVGSIPEYASGTPLAEIGSTYMKSGEFVPKYSGHAHAEGTALVSGNWAVQSNETNALVGEVGYEIVVRNGRFFTVGDNGPEMFPIKKGDIVFNHEQSVELLKNGHTSGKGKAYADGTVGGGKFIDQNGNIYTPYNPDLDPSGLGEIFKKWDTYMESINNNVDKLTTNTMHERNRQMQEITNQINNNTSIINSRNQPNINVGGITITCPGVTSQEVMREVGFALDEKFNGFHNLADQYSRT